MALSREHRQVLDNAGLRVVGYKLETYGGGNTPRINPSFRPEGPVHGLAPSFR